MAENKNLTLILLSGRLPLEIMSEVDRLARKYGFGVYLSTLQNLRLVDIKEQDFEVIKAKLAAVGADLKGPGRFPKPKVCVGKPHCKLAMDDIQVLSEKIWNRFKERKDIKPKFKVAIAACPASCSNALIADIGIVATRAGYDVYVGGKGGTLPKVGRKVIRKAAGDEVIRAIAEIVAFHDRKTGKKQRLHKLLDDPEFPYRL